MQLLARQLVQMLIPLSKPALAAVTLFCIVNHWNSFFDGMILIDTPEKISTADLYLVTGYLYFRYVSIRTVYRTAGRENVIKNLQWIQNSYFYRSDFNHLSIFAEILCVRNHLGICKGMSNRKFETVGRSF